MEIYLEYHKNLTFKSLDFSIEEFVDHVAKQVPIRELYEGSKIFSSKFFTQDLDTINFAK